jgi:hypothetical protein
VSHETELLQTGRGTDPEDGFLRLSKIEQCGGVHVCGMSLNEEDCELLADGQT